MLRIGERQWLQRPGLFKTALKPPVPTPKNRQILEALPLFWKTAFFRFTITARLGFSPRSEGSYEICRLERERATLRGLISHHQSHTPLPELIERLNRHLRGWSNYFGLGYPRGAFRHLNAFVQYRLGMHLRRRSQRGWRARVGVSLYAHLDHLGLVAL